LGGEVAPLFRASDLEGKGSFETWPRPPLCRLEGDSSKTNQKAVEEIEIAVGGFEQGILIAWYRSAVSRPNRFATVFISRSLTSF